MKLYNHLQPKEARFIINLANKKNSIYKIAKKTGISKGKIKRYLNKCKIETIKQKLIRP